ncbi:MAG: hypothetical protein A3G33_05365 [Omnitrophica bacterium RIFCSPLOWO2_12_FULL_44_17]|uniref:Lipoprotein n=1 Tax=Candidatus Danuiimicrobium aquiferis TaxID=1801832 RepID=A0A1G1KQ61_9BACT|nr:MAG: hypothetical protein A3B72_05070 [Omnitrophica bacterium RIFCSPHIGHO2_02_FULL_45_28]OGW91086.1 MAG: hypothetical protein A3E74_00140 [Omnitrophica bacterium RIFCSPHIGHO2_12_FULL_44_12]OGW95060.1 MAG: hypothetical protein A3G33_05365 [Omnitrophica bacterium RIFCSPLOWO2_12_FULL_44_17]OGX02980.1 MAG: hypothetical protein A3J12_01590 [Omnitrophica bacterium RIFCSPLOWO2_02_FULL_44_11]
MKKFLNLALVFPLVFLVVFGCAKKVDTTKSIEQITADVQKMAKADLETMAQAYVTQIKAKQADFNKVRDQLKSIPPAELLGEKSKAVRNELSKLSREVSELAKRYNIYANKYKEVGGDPTKIQIK